MLNRRLILIEQECEGDYSYNGDFVCTPNFKYIFKEEYMDIAYSALEIIKKTYTHADGIQVFYYGDIMFYVLSQKKVGEKENNKKRQITFLLPCEY